MASRTTIFILAAFVIFYSITMVAIATDGVYNKKSYVNFTVTFFMFLGIAGATIRHERLLDDDLVPRLLIPQAHGRLYNSLGPIIGFLLSFFLYKRDIPVHCLPLYVTFLSGFTCVFLCVVHATPVNTDFGLLNTFAGLAWTYSLKVYGLGFPTYFAGGFCGVLVLVRGYIDRRAVEAAGAEFQPLDDAE